MCHGADMASEELPASPDISPRHRCGFRTVGEDMERTYDRGGSRPGIMAFKQQLEYSDLASAPDDGLRYEILDGELLVTPAPSLV